MASQVTTPPSPSDNLATQSSRNQRQQARSSQSATLTQASHNSHDQPVKASPQDMHAQNIRGATLDITWALTCLSLPMLVLTAIFLGLIYAYEVSNSSDATTDLLGRTTSLRNGSAYYVDYSATRLVTVSSWTSTVTSFTATFVMVLISYPLAKSFVRKSQSGALETLPSSYQLGLIIALLQGGLGPLWTWLQYCFWKGRNKHTGLLWMAVLSALGGTTLSFAILGADTWLHVVTSTVNLDVLSSPASVPASTYGRGLMFDCYNGSYTPGSIEQCIGRLQPPGSRAFYNASEATRTAMNLSTSNVASSFTLNGKHLSYLTAAQPDPNLDFRATTYAMSTSCTPASQICNLEQENVCNSESGCPLGLIQMSLAMTYSCGTWLTGDLNNGTGTSFDNGTSSGGSSNIGFMLQTFRKQGFLDHISSADGSQATPNPFYFTLGGSVATSTALATDPEAVANNVYYNSAFIFNCTSTVYDLEYTSINGTVVDANYIIANETLSNNIAWTLYNARPLTWNNLESAFLTGAQQSNTSRAFADFFAGEFSRSMISMTAAITEGRSNVAEQTRESKLVARLPKAPFFTLIVLNLLYALLGIVLAVIAFTSQPKRTRNIQARLSTAGLVAALLEPQSTPQAKKSNSGVEGAFAEYYNDDKQHDTFRVMVLDSTRDNRVFEKISAGSAVLNDKSTTPVSQQAHYQQNSTGD